MQRIIYKNEEGGVSIVIPSGEVPISDLVRTVVPWGAEYEIVETSSIPTDRTFRNAWEKSGRDVVHNLDKAKLLTHDRRRAKRSLEFQPLDVQVTIPGKQVQAEDARQAIRVKYDNMQVQVDAATCVADLMGIIVNNQL